MPKASRSKGRYGSATGMPFALTIAITNAWVSQLFDEEMAKKGVAPFQAGTLMMIKLHEPVTPTGLEAVMGLAGTTLRDRIRELTRMGLVERVPNDEDGRSYYLRTTAQAAEVVRQAFATTRRVSRLLEKQGVGDIEALGQRLDDVRAATKELIGEGVRSGSGSRTTGPW